MLAVVFRRPIQWQIGLVLGLFAAALASLWYASTAVVGREQRRAAAHDRLERAGLALLAEGAMAFRAIRPYPEYMGPDEWDAVDRLLDAAARRVAARCGEIGCGYYLPGRADQDLRFAAARLAGLSSGIVDDIETQADAAYRKKKPLSVVEVVPPDAVAIQAAPARVAQQVVGSVWAVIRLEDPIYLDQSGQAYGLFAGLALAGIGLSTVLTGHLVATIRRQAVERERLQHHLRRNERLAALGQLLAGVAHEVRNPLAGIRSTAQLWQRGFAVDTESLAGLVHEVDRLEGIVANLLQFSRADLQPRIVGTLNDIVAEAARLAEPAAEAAGVSIATELGPGLPAVEMVPAALLQIFRNLTNNAIQAMPSGGPLRLCTRLDPAQRQILASVVDGGPGLSAGVLEHLFEPFFTTRTEGTGLGLAIAREIALAHGGDLRAENREDGLGATFTLTLPAVAPGTLGGPQR